MFLDADSTMTMRNTMMRIIQVELPLTTKVRYHTPDERQHEISIQDLTDEEVENYLVSYAKVFRRRAKGHV